MTLGCPLMYSLKLQRLGMADRKMLNFYFQVTCCFLAEILVLFFLMPFLPAAERLSLVVGFVVVLGKTFLLMFG